MVQLPFYLFRITALLLCCTPFFSSYAQSGRTATDLSGYNWKLWPDTAANWQNDKLYAPPVTLTTLPVNPPTGGWAALQQVKGTKVHLPATVEAYHWGANGNANGVSGNYLGVSWFTTTIQVPSGARRQRVSLQFEAVRFRAEIYINRQLAGYDLVNSTSFEVDITPYVKWGAPNEVAVRITDPNGNFDWRDSQNFMWGDYRTSPSHGFGGITGKVKLVTTTPSYISDIFISNKPKVKEIDAAITICNSAAALVAGVLQVQVKENKAAGKIVYQNSFSLPAVKDSFTHQVTIELTNAKLWSVDSPHLYTLEATWKTSNTQQDKDSRRFGFRWLEIKDINGDKQFYLNGKRIVLLTAISWGFWPVNGIMPSDSLARKQIEAAKKLGMNMLSFHRTIGQQNVLDYADELGLLYYAEPGGNQYPADRFNATDALGKQQADFYFKVRNEKLTRMIRQFRSHPSLIIYNLHNERGAPPQAQDSAQMRMAHQLDQSRILTYNSSNGSIKMGPDNRFKLHLLPYDTTFRDYGWFDQHHAGGSGTYHDNLYKGPRNYAKYFDHPDEIIYYGEEGAIGTPPRLQLIKDAIIKEGTLNAWESKNYLQWYDAYHTFLNNNTGFKQAFPNVDSLTRNMGNVAYYYQGRTIENVRISNLTDGYAINGWESMKLENHSGVVDNYRNLKGDASLIARYNKPLYVSVKLNNKVVATGDTVVADFYIVNQINISGTCQLEISVKNEKAQVVHSRKIPVTVTGGHVYGELLFQGLSLGAGTAGYTTVNASLTQNGKTIARGDDQFYTVQPDVSAIDNDGMIADTTGIYTTFLNSAGIQAKPYRSGRPDGKYLVIGAFMPQQTGNPLVTDILEWVNEGNTLIVLNNCIEKWAEHLAQKEVLDYRGYKTLRTTWYGGNFFSKSHPLFNGLPQAQVFNWEYQCFVTYNKYRTGLRLYNGEPVVACVADHQPEVYSALQIIPHGRGKIILSTLDIFACLREVTTGKKAEGEGENAAMSTFNTSSRNKANIVGKQLLLNMLKYAR